MGCDVDAIHVNILLQPEEIRMMDKGMWTNLRCRLGSFSHIFVKFALFSLILF